MRVLEFFGEPLSYGGQESFMINVYQYFDLENEYCFVTPFYFNNTFLRSLILQKNDTSIADNCDFDSRNRKKYIIATAKRTITDEYDVVHIHSGSVFTLLIVARIAKQRGVKKVIVHSHATGNDNLTHKVIKMVSDLFLEKYADYFLACSLEAGRFKFSEKILRSSRFRIIRNGIDIKKFTFDKDTRVIKRKELGVDNRTVICNVGRYSPEKNQVFLLDVLQEYLKLDPKGMLLLIGGTGIMQEEIKSCIDTLHLQKYVIMLQERNDIPELLSAADYFVFPSLFEGLGMSAIEAQAAGLVTLCSEYIPDDANVSPLYRKLPIEKGAEAWAQYIFHTLDSRRLDTSKEIERNGYSSSKCAEQLEKIYFDLGEDTDNDIE